MSLPNVTINIDRTGLGGVALTEDRIMGICLTGVAVSGKLVLDTPHAIYSLDDAIALGIDSTNNPDAYNQLVDFYAEAGRGAKIWVIVSANTMDIDHKVDKSQTICQAKILAQSAGGEIKVMGICWRPATPYSPTILDGLDTKVYSAVTHADSLAADFVAQIMPFSVILEGNGFTGIETNLRNLTSMTNSRVAITLAARSAGKEASIGSILGRLAHVPVQRKISRVLDGAISIATAYLTDGAIIDDRLDKLGTMHDKGFIIYRKFANKSGYYFNADHTTTGASDDLNSLARIRTIDKALTITYNTYVEEIDEEVTINSDGTLDASVIASLQAKIDRNINLNMGGEISSFESYIDPSQNILSVARLNIVLRITPVGYMTNIVVSLGFKNPAL